ncbi:MAG: hypothetical protein HYV52_01255 [Parcubacteria group bacterium]|nr:hypothetical protein [Parcubacteria group bacterium]
MRKTKNLIYFAIISLGLFGGVGFASAAVQITNTGGAFVHNGIVTIAGSGFGTKATAAPLKWENFENGTNGNDVESTGYWTNRDDQADAKFTNKNQRNSRSSLSVVDRMVYPGTGFGPGNNGFYKLNAWTTTGIKYISGYLYVSMVSLQSLVDWQIKLIHIGSGPAHADEPVLALQSWWEADGTIGSSGNYYEFRTGSTGGEWIPSTWDDWIRPAQWVRFEIEFRDSTDANSSDGVANWVAYHSDGTVVRRSKTGVTISQTGTYLSTPHFGYGLVNVPTGQAVSTYWDDLYIDNSWARVEVCAGATSTIRNKCEIQIPSAWSNTSIIITLNQGSFSDFISTYLYVIDENGNVNANGYLLTTSDTTPPSAPTGLVVL